MSRSPQVAAALTGKECSSLHPGLRAGSPAWPMAVHRCHSQGSRTQRTQEGQGCHAQSLP